MRFVNRLKTLYAKWERPISSLSLIGGFIFDAITLQRVDELWENVWVFGHLAIVAVFMVLANSKSHREGDEYDPSRPNFWYVNILQFFFGGLLSTYLVFYFRSADLAVSWLFILILTVAFWMNESLKRRYVRMSFQVSLLFLSIFSFAIFILPVIFHSIGQGMFVFSGLVSLFLILLFCLVLKWHNRSRFEASKKLVVTSIISIFAVMNILYFTNIIPPIPLSLKSGGIFYNISRDSNGDYVGNFYDNGWRGYFTLYDKVLVWQSESVYAYSAVFSPTDLNIDIVHEWQSLDSKTGEWVTQEKIILPLVGGREGGYRTYSLKNNLTPGRWRVNVETLNGQTIGRIRFNVIVQVADSIKTENKILR